VAGPLFSWRNTAIAGVAWSLCVGPSCSLVNSYDDVATGTANAGSAGNGGTAGEGDGGTSSGNGGSAGLGVGGTQPDPPDGGPPLVQGPLVVIGGTVADSRGGTTRVMSVLDPLTGVELAREDLGLAGIAYDGNTDLWYLFIANSYPAPREVPVDMQVRRWIGTEWVHVASVPAIPPPAAEQFAVLNQRLVYASWRIGPGNMPVQAITIFDTSDPTALGEIMVPQDVVTPDDLTNPIVDLIGTPGRPNDARALGGDLTLLLAKSCRVGTVETTCELSAQPVTVGTSISRGVVRSFGLYTGSPAATHAATRDLLLVATPQASPLSVVLRQFNSRTLADVGTSVTSTSTTQQVSGVAYGDCLDAALFAEAAPGAGNDTSLFAVSLVNALGTRDALGRPGEGVYFEPFTRTLIAPYRGEPTLPAGADAGADAGAPAPPEIVAYRVSASGPSVAMERRRAPNWQPPTDVSVDTLAVRAPRNFVCAE
jgi:hypothetical protein